MKKNLKKILILLILFVLAVAGYFTWSWMQLREDGAVYTSIEDANLPVAYVNILGRRMNELDGFVELALKAVAFGVEVKDRLKSSALGMSGGQQQRLCIARALAVKPDILLLDESTSALDPISTSKIEDLIGELKKEYTVIMVTHNMQQAVRISDKTAFFLLGEMVEFGDTEQIFSAPKNQKTEDYISGRFG